MKTEKLEGISEVKNDFCVVCAVDRPFVYVGYNDLGNRIDVYYRCTICNAIVPEIIKRPEKIIIRVMKPNIVEPKVMRPDVPFR